jgi:hypothetical protein
MKANQIMRNRDAVLLAILLLVSFFGSSPIMQAVSPPPDGGYANGNTAEGTDALFGFTTGGWNTALGFRALYSNDVGQKNTATGYKSLLVNTTGHDNTANGVAALFHNTTGSVNTAVGSFALQSNTEAFANTAVGFKTLYHSIGAGNIALGVISHPTFGASFTPAGFDITTGSNNIDIGNAGVDGESGVIRIGTASVCCSHGQSEPIHVATYIAGIATSPVIGNQVSVDGDGRLGIGPPSSARFKRELKRMNATSEAILSLKPVTFRYNNDLDPNGSQQFGLVAEEVEKVNPDLVTRDDQGKAYTVRYDAVNAMLLNEFLKEHQKVEKLQATVEQLTVRLKEQDSKIEKISNERATDTVRTTRNSYGGPAPHLAASR